MAQVEASGAAAPVSIARTVTRAILAALLALLVLWAFVSYLEPVFTGEQAGELLRCN